MKKYTIKNNSSIGLKTCVPEFLTYGGTEVTSATLNLYCGHNLVNWGHNLITCGHNLVTCGHNLLTWGHDLLNCGHNLITCGHS